MSRNQEPRPYLDARWISNTLHITELAETSVPSHHSSIIMEEFKKFYKLEEPKFDGTNANRVNVMKSLNKLLTKPKCNWDEKIMARAMDLTYRQLKDCLEQGPCLEPEITQKSRPALWWKYYGFETKEDVLNSSIFWEAYSECVRGVREFPPYCVSGKREFLSDQELLEGKIRTFVLESLELVVEHHFLWGNQNKYMSERQPGFIRYGINLHDGGFHKMITESWRAFWSMLDVRGWDRAFPLSSQCQELRYKGMKNWYKKNGHKMPQDIKDRIARANAAYCHPKILLPSGQIVQTDWGQVSGSVQTTSNNCIGHQIIENYKMISASPWATDDEIVDQGGNLYGDDLLNSYSEIFSALREEKFVNSIYKQFGMEVKPGTFHVAPTPVGMSFLGGEVTAFKYNGQIYYIPSYPRDRVNAALQWSLEPLTPDDELNKAYAILELGWEHSYQPISAYISYLFQKVPETPVKRSFVRKGIPSKQAIMLSWAGIRPQY